MAWISEDGRLRSLIDKGESGNPENGRLWSEVDKDTFGAAPVITDAGDEDFAYDETNIVLTGTDFGATETGSAKVELADSATYGGATKVTQTVDTWADTSIQFDLVPTGFTQNNLWLYVTNAGGTVSNAWAVTVHLIPVITDAGDEDFAYNETNIVLTGTDFFATQTGVAKVELGDSATYGSATKVTQTIDTWSDTSIQFDLVPTGFTQNNLWLYTTNSFGGVSNAWAVTVHLIPTITDAGDEIFTVYETDITVTGTDFYATQSTGKLELGDNATYAAATKVTQSIDTWADTSLQFDLTIGALDVESLWLFASNSFGGVSNAWAVTVGLTPTVTAVGDDSIISNETDIVLTGDTFLNAQGTGKIELSDNATYATGTKVTQSIDTWANGSIQFDVVIGSLTDTTLWAWVTNDLGFRNATGYSFSMSYPVLPAITDVDGDEILTVYQTNVVATGTDFGTNTGLADIELGDNAIYGSANLVSQSIDSWADTSIQFDVTIGALDQENLWLYVTDSAGDTGNAFAVTVGLTPTVTAVGDDSIFSLDTDVVSTGDTFLNAQGTGKFELSDNSTYAAGTKVTQTIDTWADGSIQFDVVIGSLSNATLYAWVTNDLGFRNATGYSFSMSYPVPPEPLYQTAGIVGVINSSGFTTTIFLLSDE